MEMETTWKSWEHAFNANFRVFFFKKQNSVFLNFSTRPDKNISLSKLLLGIRD